VHLRWRAAAGLRVDVVICAEYGDLLAVEERQVIGTVTGHLIDAQAIGPRQGYLARFAKLDPLAVGLNGFESVGRMCN
jgi:hypothetical protein